MGGDKECDQLLSCFLASGSADKNGGEKELSIKVARKRSDDGNSRHGAQLLNLMQRDLCIPARHTIRRHLVFPVRTAG